jgi:hypothetical protein
MTDQITPTPAEDQGTPAEDQEQPGPDAEGQDQPDTDQQAEDQPIRGSGRRRERGGAPRPPRR